MDEKGKYIYCIIQTSRFAPCNSFGIKDENKDYNPPTTLPFAESKRAPKSFGCIGINDREAKVVLYKDIAIVISNIPIIKFDRFNEKELIGYVATHQKVNEVVMKEYNVVPMAFGIIAPNLNEVARILEKAYLQFKTALKNVAGKAEFAVQIWWDPKRLLEELANTNPEIQKLKQEVSSKGSILGMPMKLKLGKLIQREAEIRREAFVNDIHLLLRNLSSDSTSNKLIDDDMIANLSFLIEKTKESELDKKMQELGKKYEGKLRFKYIGPMPPYSFVNINLSLGNFEIVNEARKLLGVEEEATFNEIQKAYHTLAHQYHPDKHQQNKERFKEQMKEQMEKINQAYSILGNYCQSCDELSGQKSHKYSFKKEDVENALIIN